MAVLERLPRGLRELLDHHPAPGGRNRWLYLVALRCRGRCSEESLRRFFWELRTRWDVGRPITDAEIERAIANGFRGDGGSTADSRAVHGLLTPEWPEPDLERRRFHSSSAEPIFDPSRPLDLDAGRAIDALFPGGGLLCLGKRSDLGATWDREYWRGHESDLQFIVPSRMIAPEGRNASGNASFRTLSNVGPREYLVVESDIGSDRAEQARFLSHLAGIGPLVMVVDSGGKSLHGWFDCRRAPHHRIARFFQYAVWLGADSSLWNPCGWVRLPGGTRSGGARQPILHFDPPS